MARVIGIKVPESPPKLIRERSTLWIDPSVAQAFRAVVRRPKKPVVLKVIDVKKPRRRFSFEEEA